MGECVGVGWPVEGRFVYPNGMSCSRPVTCERSPGHYGWTEWQCENNNRLGASGPSLGHPASHDGAYIVQAGSNLKSVYCDYDSQCPLWGWSPSDQKWYKVCVEAGTSMRARLLALGRPPQRGRVGVLLSLPLNEANFFALLPPFFERSAVIFSLNQTPPLCLRLLLWISPISDRFCPI